MSAPTTTKAPAKQPLWQMDVRQRLGLTPGRTDAISRLLMGALYAAEDEDEFLASIENHRDEIQAAIETVRQIERERMVAAINGEKL